MNNNDNANTELAIVNPGEMFRVATDVAGVCGAIVKQTAVNIQGKKYVKAEGWNAIAAAHGCAASARDVMHVDGDGTKGEPGGIRAIGELRRISDGTLIATAEGFVGNDEKKWADGPEYARRAMAQTRAISRVCRSAFAHVVVLIDAGLQTTPAEEVPENGFEKSAHYLDRPASGTFERAARAVEQKPTGSFQEAKRAMQEPEGIGNGWKDVICTYGKSDGNIRGKTLGHISHFAPKVMDTLYQKFVDPQELKVISEKDQPLRQGLIEWKVWELEQREKRERFEASRKQDEEAVATEEVAW